MSKPIVLGTRVVDDASAPRTPEPLGKKRTRLFEDARPGSTKELKQKHEAQGQCPANCDQSASSSADQLMEPAAHGSGVGNEQGSSVVGGHVHGEEVLTNQSEKYSAPAPSLSPTKRSTPCEGAVMSLRGSDGRVRPGSTRCTLLQRVGEERWRVRMPSGEVQEVAENKLAVIRMPRNSVSETETAQTDQKLPQWVKIGQPEVPYRAVWFTNWTLAKVMCLPVEGRVDVPSEFQHDRISVRLPHNANCVAGERLDWAISEVRELTLASPANFKVGITANPPARLDYYGDAWGKMVIIATSSVREEVSQIEASLIREFGSLQRCCNVAPGGEGEKRMKGGQFFTYVVLSRT